MSSYLILYVYVYSRMRQQHLHYVSMTYVRRRHKSRFSGLHYIMKRNRAVSQFVNTDKQIVQFTKPNAKHSQTCSLIPLYSGTNLLQLLSSATLVQSSRLP